MVTPLDLSSAQFGLVLVYFIYGLAFFTMGIALALEAGRSPFLLEKPILLPLALFGLFHGAHEWIEIIFLQGIWLKMPFPNELQRMKVALLVISFLPLLFFGLLMLFSKTRSWKLGMVTTAFLAVTLGLMAFHSRIDVENSIARSDDLARYLLAVPGGVLAGIGLAIRAAQLRREGRQQLGDRFYWSALCFGLYGLTQLLVPFSGMFPARIMNSAWFLNATGIPVQVFRAGFAMMITLNLVRAIQLVDQEREHQLVEAQRNRLEALEQIQRESQKRETMRRELLRHTVIAQEEERGRIARELHDETAQVLSAFSLNLATLRDLFPRRSEKKEILERLNQLTRQMSQGLYRLVNDLRPAQLDDLGLPAALHHLGEILHSQQGFKVDVEIIGPKFRLDPLVETVIFRVAQEALANASRYAKTDRAVVRLSYLPGQARLEVADQGVGFNLSSELIPPHGWGLAGMRERVESVGGSIEIITAAGKGTQVIAGFPLAINQGKASGQGEQPVETSDPSTHLMGKDVVFPPMYGGK